MNATLGNAVELIVSIIALVKCEIQVVQSSLLGSILSNLLLVLGMCVALFGRPLYIAPQADAAVFCRCFFAGGIKFQEQGFKDTAAQLNSSLLVISVIGASPSCTSCSPCTPDGFSLHLAQRFSSPPATTPPLPTTRRPRSSRTASSRCRAASPSSSSSSTSLTVRRTSPSPCESA